MTDRRDRDSPLHSPPQSSPMPPQLTIHANCLARRVNGVWQGILLRGESGSGKSDLSLRLMAVGWHLVADDQTIIRPTGDKAGQMAIIAQCPAAIHGMIEIRGAGLLPVSDTVAINEYIPILAVFDLVASDREIERYPEPLNQFAEYFGLAIPKWVILGFAASAVAKIEFLLHNLPMVKA